MARHSYKVVVRLAVPDRAGKIPLGSEARAYIRDEIEKQAGALVGETNLHRLHERYHAHARHLAAEARRELLPKRAKKVHAGSPDSADPAPLASDRPPPPGDGAGLAPLQPSPPDPSGETGGAKITASLEHAGAASIDLTPGKRPSD
jgi:hypothetical protein